MRTTIACERCRRSKVKCKHNGSAPCVGCLKSDNVQFCILSGPNLNRKGSASPSSGVGHPSSRPSKRKRRRRDGGDGGDGAVASTGPPDGADEELTATFDGIPQDRFAKAIAVFQAQFPEFGIFHPDDLDPQTFQINAIRKLRLLALLAVSNRYLDPPSGVSDKQYAEIVARGLHRRVTAVPSLHLIQAFLILSLYDWGEGEGFRAWMHAGIACRMAQGTLAASPPSGSRRVLSELENRTVWACFVMDKFLSCGKRRQAMFCLDKMDIPLPVNDTEFVFGSTRVQLASQNDEYAPATIYGASDYLLLIIRGLNIWSRVHTWIAEGGRKQPGMTEAPQCPWQTTSEWHQMKQELLQWRSSQDAQLLYPNTKVVVHVHLRQAERFGYINLVYYISLLFLCREYIPFAPVGETRPRGPIERPLLCEAGPDDFWAQNVVDLFHAATQISSILKDLRLAGSSIHSPFTGLCAFSAALFSYYAAAFPSFMGFDETQVASVEEQARESMSDLERVGEVWRIAEEWINVANTAKTLFSRITSSTHGRPVRRSRYDYPELEDSMHLAPLKGMPRTGFDHSNVHNTLEEEGSAPNYPPEDSRVEYISNIQGGASLEGTLMIDDNIMDEDGWRLFSFWDDPHLLSSFGEYGTQWSGLSSSS